MAVFEHAFPVSGAEYVPLVVYVFPSTDQTYSPHVVTVVVGSSPGGKSNA